MNCNSPRLFLNPSLSTPHPPLHCIHLQFTRRKKIWELFIVIISVTPDLISIFWCFSSNLWLFTRPLDHAFLLTACKTTSLPWRARQLITCTFPLFPPGHPTLIDYLSGRRKASARRINNSSFSLILQQQEDLRGIKPVYYLLIFCSIYGLSRRHVSYYCMAVDHVTGPINNKQTRRSADWAVGQGSWLSLGATGRSLSISGNESGSVHHDSKWNYLFSLP
jgi:hypothetical protein